MKINQLQSQSCCRARNVAVAALAFVASLGCGAKQKVDENRAVISGAVSIDGKPLPGGTMSFYSPDQGLGASISLAKGGTFTTDRAPIGHNLVSIETESLQYGSPGLYVKIPAKYADPAQSGLTVDVKPGENENVNFELKSAP
jgi:hypothetical protein